VIGLPVIGLKKNNYITAFDIALVSTLVEKAGCPVMPEGRVNTPDIAAECIQAGALAVVVGSTITRPQETTKQIAKEFPRLK
jgi:N-acylglucosamine-6-phosphate 2-epimerase